MTSFVKPRLYGIIFINFGKNMHAACLREQCGLVASFAVSTEIRSSLISKA